MQRFVNAHALCIVACLQAAVQERTGLRSLAGDSKPCDSRHLQQVPATLSCGLAIPMGRQPLNGLFQNQIFKEG